MCAPLHALSPFQALNPEKRPTERSAVCWMPLRMMPCALYPGAARGASVAVCFFESMEYQRLAPKQVVGWEEGLAQGLHSKKPRKQLQLKMKLAIREVITYMTVHPSPPPTWPRVAVGTVLWH